jgi:hypothetical protein
VTKFAVPVVGQGYTARRGNAVIATELDGGRPRLRRDILNPSSRVTVSWVFNAEQYNYYQAFYHTTTIEGSLPFDIDLIIDRANKQEYEASFVPESSQLTSKQGDVFFVSAELYVTAAVRDATADAALVTAYNEARGLTG